VDGVHDRETLRHLGFVNPIFTRSRYTYIELADRIARRYSRVAVLTDFDNEGKVADEKLSKLLKERKVKVCKSCRKTLEALLKDEKITSIEGIYGLLI
jgi:5S rRNA maturation endonuclease (ribonuclease M5)